MAIEAQGARIIPVMMKAMDAVRANESSVVTDSLVKFSECIREIGQMLNRMTEKCAPQTFYHDIRPFLAGSKNMEVAGLPNGVFYDEGNGKGEWRKCSGGSNAQSSLIQFFDVILGVQHSPTASPGPLSSPPKTNFLQVRTAAPCSINRFKLIPGQEMRKYMPGKHRKFLDHLESVANIKGYAESTSDSDVTDAYNVAVGELKKFRDIHIGIVTKYIIIPSKQRSPPAPNAGINLAVASANPTSTQELHGTGGTHLLPFLKQSRDETRDARIA